MALPTPAAEVDVHPTLIRGLLQDQHPDLTDLSLAWEADGWDNAVFRLGPRLAVRAPRRRVAAELIRHEQRWLPDLAARLPLPIPAPVRAGHPGRGVRGAAGSGRHCRSRAQVGRVASSGAVGRPSAVAPR